MPQPGSNSKFEVDLYMIWILILGQFNWTNAPRVRTKTKAMEPWSYIKDMHPMGVLFTGLLVIVGFQLNGFNAAKAFMTGSFIVAKHLNSTGFSIKPLKCIDRQSIQITMGGNTKLAHPIRVPQWRNKMTPPFSCNHSHPVLRNLFWYFPVKIHPISFFQVFHSNYGASAKTQICSLFLLQFKFHHPWLFFQISQPLNVTINSAVKNRTTQHPSWIPA